VALVLIVDDSPTELHVLRRLLEKHGHQTLVAHDATQGIDLARREQPDLILMDVVMPNLNGFQATRSISREPTTKHIPVILVTTKDQDTDRMWGMRQGAKAYLTKPFSEDELSEVIERILSASTQTPPAA
jgi:twitching motility two-component system response regulator PilH